MRVTVAGPVKASRGQTVRFYARLRKGRSYAFCELYSSVGDYQPSPHVSVRRLHIYEKGKPQMLAPSSFRLIEGVRTEMLIEIMAEEDCRFYLMQDVDVVKDGTSVVAKGHAYGRFRTAALSAIRWILGNPEWPVRREDGQVYRVDG